MPFEPARDMARREGCPGRDANGHRPDDPEPAIRRVASEVSRQGVGGQGHVVVQQEDDVPVRSGHPGVACGRAADAGRGQDLEPEPVGGAPERVGASTVGSVQDHDDLEPIRPERLLCQRVERRSESLSRPMGRDDDGDRRRAG